MIGRPDIVERVREWQLAEEVIEKDYLLGWLLWGIGADPVLGDQWIFKGGTCLKKCYIETYRFSEDLDFTVLPGGPYRPEEIEPLLDRVLARVNDASGIDFSSRAPMLRLRPDELSTEGRVYFIGPRQTRWILIRERPCQSGVDYGENRGRRPDAQRKRKHGDDGEAAVFAQAAGCVAEVTKYVFRARFPLGVADFFFGAVQGAEFQARAAAGFFGLHAGGYVIGDLTVEVELQFFVERFFSL